MVRRLTYILYSINILLIFGFLIFSGFSATAQRTCGTPLAVKQAIQRNPALLKKYQRLKSHPGLSTKDEVNARGPARAVIPVVVHIVLPDPDIISDAQVESQIAVLNADYGLNNADTVNVPDVWKDIEGDMKIAFCLARRTPAGAPTNGIERVKTNQRGFSIDFAAEGVKHSSSGGTEAWNTDDYLNIWVCNINGDYLGIGTPPEIYPHDEQGAVIQYNAFGTIGNLLPDFNKGRTCTHEIGHIFTLLHPWGEEEACFPGDYVDDTPPQSAPVYEDPSFPYLKDLCSPNFPGIMINNFMGYVNDSIMNMFTKGQVERVKASLSGDRASLVSSDGCKPVNLKNRDARLKTISAPGGKLCQENVTPVVVLQNFGNEPLQKVNIKYRIDNGNTQNYHWKGQLETLDSVKIDLPSTTTAIGHHQIKVYTDLPNDQPDENTANDTLTGAFHLDPVETAPYKEGFEDNTFPPPGWTINNPDHSFTWQKTGQAAHSGSSSVVMKNLEYQENGPVDDLVSPVFDLKEHDSAFLFFNIAAAVQSEPGGSNTYWDTIEVLISYDCGQTGTTVYKKWGKDLITTAGPTTDEFVPKQDQWRRDSINITSFLDKGPFRIIFRNITNFENNIYLDDIQVETKQINPILKERKVLVVPNPFVNHLQVQFLTFPSDLQAVSIYNAAGQVVAQKGTSSVNNSNRITFDLKELPAGVYFVKLFYPGKEIVKKVIKINQ